MSRFIARMVVVVGQVVGRAFMQAYREAAASAGKQGAQHAAKQAGSNSSEAAARARIGQMDLEEARKILNVEKNASWEEITKKYDHMFKVNEKSNGGSFYLQSKIYRAKERMEMEFGPQAKTPPPPPPPADASR
eukprot:m.45302 g.45302  ORF g.45302 m.45302 type:complete len:134 (-) comp12430_c0_seq1:182-583(-)